MSAKSASRALRSSLKQLSRPAVQQRTYLTAALNAGRAGVIKQAPKIAVSVSAQQARGLKTVDFAGTKEDVFGKNTFAINCSGGNTLMGQPELD